MLRIHFTADDLARTTLAADPDPLWEVLLSLHMLQVEDGPVPYGAWRQRMRRKLPRESVGGPLAALAPPVGYSPDFLTPAASTGGFDAGLDGMLSAPRDRIRHDLSKLAARRSAVTWVRQLAEVRPEALHRLGHSTRVYHRAALEPYWGSLITLATASHQTAVLRDAGLIESRRHGRSVQHRATQLGHALLEGSAPV